MRGRGEGSIRQRRRANGDVYWEARVSIHGRQVSFYDAAKSVAQAKARQARADAERGYTRYTSAVSVADYLAGWLARIQPTVRTRTFTNYQHAVRAYIVPHVGRLQLAQLAPSHVTAMLARIVASGRSETTARLVRTALSSALRDAQVDIGLATNAARLATSPKSGRPPFAPETMTPDEARAILAAFAGHALEPAVTFALATGLRQGEQFALRWRDVDTDARTVTVHHTVDVPGGRRVLARPKSDSGVRTIGLPDLAMRALAMRREREPLERAAAGRDWRDCELVFPGPRGGIRDLTGVRAMWYRRLAAAGLPRVRWHALRRAYAAILQDAGVPLERIRDLLGHSTVAVTEHYAYNLPERLAADVRAIDSALD